MLRPIKNRLLLSLLALGIAIALLLLSDPLTQAISVRVERWVGVQQLAGTVTLLQGTGSRTARVGDRLQAVGDGIRTAPTSTATLAVDTGIGFIDVTDNTEIRVQSLSVAPDGGRITLLRISQGQARLRIRPFTNRGSQLEIQTPAGVAGVRGTEFGVSVQADGKTGLATLRGAIATQAQGRQVQVAGGYQNLIFPGEPPTAPTPITNNTGLNYRVERFFQGSTRYVRLIGQVDPVNIVLVNEQPQSIGRNGGFELALPAVAHLAVRITVVTPLGVRETHALSLL